MYTNVNLESHIAALLLLGSGGLIVLLLIMAAVLFFARPGWVRYPLLAAAAVGLGYGLLLAAYSLISSEQTLPRGEEKHFCELDCHIAYSVQDVRRVKAIGDTAASGEFTVITLRTRFDEDTIASWRGRERPLIPDPIAMALVDTNGHRYAVSGAGQTAWNAAHGQAHSMQECLRPGESYETTWVFDLPAEVSSPRLLLSSVQKPSLVLIGDEDSPRHQKTYLGL